MSLQNQFSKFDEKIRLTWQNSKLQEIREKDESIKEDIKAAFKDKGYSFIKFFQQGSYATHTCIEPENEDDDYDIDVGVVIDSENAPDNPVDVKKTLRDVLVNRGLKNPKIKMPCVTAQYYKEGEKRFHLDYPVYKVNHGSYYHAIGKEFSDEKSRKWESSDPEGLIDWVNDKLAVGGEEKYSQYKRLIRYLKRWRNYCITGVERKQIYSIGLTVMIRESFNSCISVDGEFNDLESLKNTVATILNNCYFSCYHFDANNNPQYDVVVYLPVIPKLDIFFKHGRTLGTFFHDKLTLLKKNLQKADDEVTLKKKCQILADDVFGDDFPIPEDNSKSSNIKFKESGFIASPQGA